MFFFIKTISENLLAINKKCNVKIGFSISNTLINLIKLGKDFTDRMAHNGIVYTISCQDTMTQLYSLN